jgi:ADP-ribose pyrophosphatase YjhB (NUDIX family)
VALLDGWTTCPRCGSQLTPGDGLVECRACEFVHYAHSAVTASALPEDGDRVMLARRACDPFHGLWDVVGGFVGDGEHPLEGLRREVREETGLGFQVDKLLGIWMGDYDGRATLNLYWTGRLAAGRPTPADDVAELRWFAADELPPPGELAFDGLMEDVLAAWRKQHA